MIDNKNKCKKKVKKPKGLKGSYESHVEFWNDLNCRLVIAQEKKIIIVKW